MYDKPQFEIPEAVRELAERNVEQARSAYSQFMEMTRRVQDTLAKSGGAYEVEVAATNGGRPLVAVTLGLFDDAAGLVQVSGSRLAAGQRVVVPTL